MKRRSITMLLIHEDCETVTQMLVGEIPPNLKNVEILHSEDVMPAQEDGTSDITTPIAAALNFIRNLLDEHAADPHDLQSAHLEVVTLAQEIMDTRKAYARG